MKSKYKFWCQACGSYGAPGDGPCTVPGHRSERLYRGGGANAGKFFRYTRPVITEAAERDGKIVHLGVRS